VVEVIYSPARTEKQDGYGFMEVLHIILILSLLVQIMFMAHRMYQSYWGEGKERRMLLKEKVGKS